MIFAIGQGLCASSKDARAILGAEAVLPKIGLQQPALTGVAE